jgi:mediator of RNA polymerase II transcription subunit 31
MAANPTNNHDWKAKYEISDRDRFELELEFVECLANPEYLNWLAQTQLFNDPDFIKFLNYLKYWQQPEYSHFITCAHSTQQSAYPRPSTFCAKDYRCCEDVTQVSSC